MKLWKSRHILDVIRWAIIPFAFSIELWLKYPREKTVGLSLPDNCLPSYIKRKREVRERGRREWEKERRLLKGGVVVPVLCGQSRENHGRSAFQRGQVSTSVLTTQQTSAVVFPFRFNIKITCRLQLAHFDLLLLCDTQFFKQHYTVIMYSIKDWNWTPEGSMGGSMGNWYLV